MALNLTNNTRVYQKTTISLPRKTAEQSKQSRKKLLEDKNELGENFIAPDGGWAWVVCIGAGMSNFVIFSIMHMFGLLFRERLITLGLSSSEITTIINVNAATAACSGLLNGPMFRQYTYRQVAVAGALFIFLGLFLTAFCDSFLTFLLTYSLLYGFGMGISSSASSLALTIYFQTKRRMATGFAWSIAGGGPIVFPYLIMFLVDKYGVQATVVLFAAISLHCLVSALSYQPVEYHTPKPNTQESGAENSLTTEHNVCKWCQSQQPRHSTSIFSSRYLFQCDDEEQPGYEITAPGTPMLARANDGWYGSRLSVSSKFRPVQSSKDMRELCALTTEDKEQQVDFLKPNYFKRELQSFSSMSQFHRNQSFTHTSHCTCPEIIEESNEDQDKPENLTFMKKIVIFFDLDLLRDITFVNLVTGLTIIYFSEINFTVLTPFILHDFGLTDAQISNVMSLQAVLDLLTRFMLPFVTEKINWDNRIFFLIGIIGIAMGRTVLACTATYSVIVASFIMIGLCKGFRTVFWPLIIPSVVPLKRLPAATGLQLVITGLFGLAGGPLVGIISDAYNYSVCIHFLDFLAFLAAFLWILEAIIRRYIKNDKVVVKIGI